MLDSIQDFIKACSRCQRANAAPKIHQASRVLNGETLWTTVAFDFFGLLKKKLLVVMCISSLASIILVDGQRRLL